MDPIEPRLARVALRAAYAPDLRGFLRETVLGAAELLEARAGAIYLWRSGALDELPEELLVPFSRSPAPATSAGEASPGGGPLAGETSVSTGIERRVMTLPGGRRLRQSLPEGGFLSEQLPDAADWEGWPARAGLAVPILHRPGCFCAAVLAFPAGGGGFGEEEVRRGADLARVVAPLLATQLRVRELEDLIVRDDTVGCYNRRHFEEFLAQETLRARRFRTPLSLIFLDMDNLKSVNSAHGHHRGSLVLREVARRIAGSIRRIDKLIRFGGDEFCIVLPETGVQGALEVAERVRGCIAVRLFLEGELDQGVRMTASLGLATFPLHAGTAKDMVAVADEAMRRIKATGKNSVSVAIQPAPGAPDTPEASR